MEFFSCKMSYCRLSGKLSFVIPIGWDPSSFLNLRVECYPDQGNSVLVPVLKAGGEFLLRRLAGFVNVLRINLVSRVGNEAPLSFLNSANSKQQFCCESTNGITLIFAAWVPALLDLIKKIFKQYRRVTLTTSENGNASRRSCFTSFKE